MVLFPMVLLSQWHGHKFDLLVLHLSEFSLIPADWLSDIDFVNAVHLFFIECIYKYDTRVVSCHSILVVHQQNSPFVFYCCNYTYQYLLSAPLLALNVWTKPAKESIAASSLIVVAWVPYFHFYYHTKLHLRVRRNWERVFITRYTDKVCEFINLVPDISPHESMTA